MYLHVLVTYLCSAQHKHRVHKFSQTTKNKVIEAYVDGESGVSDKQLAESKVDKLIFQQHRSNLVNEVIDNIPLEIISPITQITWLWMCPNWRNKLDFVFQRPPNWNDSMKVYKFNHTNYVKYHNMWDWGDWARLQNQCMIFPGMIVDPHDKDMDILYYITNVMYAIPQKLYDYFQQKKNGRGKGWDKINKADYIPDCLVDIQTLIFNKQLHKWVLSHNTKQFHVIPSFNWTNRDPNGFVGNVVTRADDGKFEDIELELPKFQHPDVAANKPFFFAILSFDKYHHTQFTGFGSMPTHGCYWWLGNIHPGCQFTDKYSMITSQAPGIIDFTIIVSAIYTEWQHLMHHGCLLPTPEGVITARGMVSHHITDMQDKDVLTRHRGCAKESRCEGGHWLAFPEGIKWPVGCESLLELNTVMNGVHVLDTWQCIQDMDFPSDYAYDKAGFPMAITLATEDVFNGLPIDSSLKSPPEINHTTVLGFVKDIFLLEYTRMHDKGGYDELFTRAIMIAYLNKCWVGVNGKKSRVADQNTNITVFNQIHHAYQTLVEIMISLPHVCNWDGGINLMCNVIRLTGCIHSCNSEDRRQSLRPIVKLVCDESMFFISVFQFIYFFILLCLCFGFFFGFDISAFFLGRYNVNTKIKTV